MANKANYVTDAEVQGFIGEVPFSDVRKARIPDGSGYYRVIKLEDRVYWVFVKSFKKVEVLDPTGFKRFMHQIAINAKREHQLSVDLERLSKGQRIMHPFLQRS